MSEHQTDHRPETKDSGGGGAFAAKTVTDPVCGMKVDPVTSKHHFDHGGTTFHFCSAGCRTKFEADPGKYLQPKVSPATPTPAGAVYTCPMHPQIRQPGPGACPICGMVLEPVEVTADAGPNHELADMSRRFWVGLVLTLPVFVLEMGSHLPWLGLGNLVPEQWSIWIQFALSTPVVLWAGWPFFARGAASLRSGHLNMFTLIALGTGAAYLYSLVATFAPGLFPSGFRMVGGTVAVYYEAAAVITVLVLLGQVLELRARAIRRVAPFEPCSISRQKLRGGCATVRTMKRCRSSKSRSATACGSGPSMACRSTAPSSTARARSMSRWSRGSRCPRPKDPTTRSSAAP